MMLNPSKALWRITFMIDSRKKHPIHTIILTCHHAIGDGISSMSLIKELMRTYEKIEKGLIVDAKPLPLLDSVEEMALSHNNLDSYISHIKMLSKKCEGAIAIERSAPLQHRKSKVLFVDFLPSEVEAMHRVAKLEKVSLNQVLMAAYAFSLQDVFKKPLKAPIYTPVDMRQRLIPTIDPSHFGMYVSYILNVMEIDRNKNSFFEFARHYKEEFEKELGFQGHPPLVTGKTTRQLFDDFEKQHLEAFDAGLSLNNLGKLPFSKEFHRHRIDAIYFSQTRKAGDFPIVHHTVTLDGAMHLCIVYVEPLMSHTTATGVMNAFIHELEKHCGFSHKSDLESRKAS